MGSRAGFHAGVRLSIRQFPLRHCCLHNPLYRLSAISYKAKSLKLKGPLGQGVHHLPVNPEHPLPGRLRGMQDTRAAPSRLTPSIPSPGCWVGCRTRGQPWDPGWVTAPTLPTNITFSLRAAGARVRSPGLLRENVLRGFGCAAAGYCCHPGLRAHPCVTLSFTLQLLPRRII